MVNPSITEKKRIGIGMLGYGFMAKAHAQAYRNLPLFFPSLPLTPELTAICGRTEAKVKEAAKNFGFKRYYTNWDNLVKDDEVKIIDNVAPPNLHFGPSITSVEMDKHIFCEKPLALDYDEALSMYKATRKTNVRHGTAFNYRFLPAVRLAKKLIEEKYVGNIIQFRGTYTEDWGHFARNHPLTWRFQRKKSGYGVLGDLGSHLLDLGRFLVGEIRGVCGQSETFVKKRTISENSNKTAKVDVEDTCTVLLKFDNKALGSIEASNIFAGEKNHLMFEIYGDEGGIKFDLNKLNELEICSTEEDFEKQGYRVIRVTEPDAHPYFSCLWPVGFNLGLAESYLIEIYEFLNSIAENKEFKPSFYDGAVNCLIMDTIEESFESKKWEKVPKFWTR